MLSVPGGLAFPHGLLKRSYMLIRAPGSSDRKEILAISNKPHRIVWGSSPIVRDRVHPPALHASINPWTPPAQRSTTNSTSWISMYYICAHWDDLHTCLWQIAFGYNHSYYFHLEPCDMKRYEKIHIKGLHIIISLITLTAFIVSFIASRQLGKFSIVNTAKFRNKSRILVLNKSNVQRNVSLSRIALNINQVVLLGCHCCSLWLPDYQMKAGKQFSKYI